MFVSLWWWLWAQKGWMRCDDPEKACDEDHIHLPNFLPEDSDNECGEQFSLEEAFCYEVDLDILGK